LLDQVVGPYEEWKTGRGELDWNDLAIELAKAQLHDVYDVVVADEAQDFSANEVRAVMNHVAPDHSVTFILDAAQRIYPRHFRWAEIGITIQPSQVFPLKDNHRNTKEIAAFAQAIIDGLELSDDGTMPDFASCKDHGPIPQVVEGPYSAQMSYLVDYIERYVNLSSESVAFLHPLGGEWFDYTRERLTNAGIRFVDMAGQTEWPTGPTNVGLSTLHSAKGLEFDHVFIVGLNRETTPVGDDPEDAQLDNLRRLIAMAAGRAKKTVVVSYKPSDVSRIVEFFDPTTYQRVKV
jgi:superfamily I DNA/RNA helicase